MKKIYTHTQRYKQNVIKQSKISATLSDLEYQIFILSVTVLSNCPTFFRDEHSLKLEHFSTFNVCKEFTFNVIFIYMHVYICIWMYV